MTTTNTVEASCFKAYLGDVKVYVDGFNLVDNVYQIPDEWFKNRRSYGQNFQVNCSLVCQLTADQARLYTEFQHKSTAKLGELLLNEENLGEYLSYFHWRIVDYANGIEAVLKPEYAADFVAYAVEATELQSLNQKTNEELNFLKSEIQQKERKITSLSGSIKTLPKFLEFIESCYQSED